MERAKNYKQIRNGNYRTGENHGRAKLSDHDVELFRQLVESKAVKLCEACEKFEISKAHGTLLMQYKRR